MWAACWPASRAERRALAASIAAAINTFTDMYYIQVPTATAAGEEAEVTFEAELFREDGSEVLSGTWICVVEDGEWKLDRLEDNRSTETPY